MGLWGIVGVMAGVCVSDRLTKSLAAHLLRRHSGAGPLRLSVSHRLPLAARASTRALAGGWIGAVGCAALALALSPVLRGQPLAVAGMAAAIAGASSNLLDWVRRGTIVDFISIGWWPAFNVADAVIVTGGIVAALSLLQ